MGDNEATRNAKEEEREEDVEADVNVHYDDCNTIHVALYNMYQIVPTDLNKILLLLLLLLLMCGWTKE